jgi:hypothetical protein
MRPSSLLQNLHWTPRNFLGLELVNWSIGGSLDASVILLILSDFWYSIETPNGQNREATRYRLNEIESPDP